MSSKQQGSARDWLTRVFGWIEDDPDMFRQISIELALLALMTVALVASLVLLRQRPLGEVAKRG